MIRYICLEQEVFLSGPDRGAGEWVRLQVVVDVDGDTGVGSLVSTWEGDWYRVLVN